MSENTYHAWTDERREQVAELWRGGLSASQIATELGKPYVTRNAVIGLIHRSGLTGQGTREPRQREAKPRMTKPHHRRKMSWSVKPLAESLPPEPVVAQKISLPEPISLRVSLIDLKPHQCRWPEGEGPFTFCGAKAVDVYCEHHRKRAYQPLVPQRRIREPA